MRYQSLDVVHELQAELGWETEFATAAYEEYVRWLHLRARANDFKTCRLPPSRVVAMVWNMHRQWTMAYEDTCARLGGYIHHFPPAMRMNVEREQAYAATVHLYKREYQEDPPSLYWGPAICPYKPQTPPTDLLPQPSAPIPDPAALPPPPAHLRPRRTTPTRNPASRKPAAHLRPRHLPEQPVLADKPLVRPPHVPKRPAAQPAPAQPASVAPAPDGADATAPTKTKKQKKGSTPLEKGLMLKPLAPGEKRKRGRPSLSDYVRISPASAAKKSGKVEDAAVGKDEASGKSPSTDAAAASKPVKLKKYSVSSSKTTPIAPAIAKKPHSGSQSHESLTNVDAVVLGKPSAENERSATPSNGDTKTGRTSAVRLAPDLSKGPVATVPLKRPRGRPRKDGSWPIPRNRQNGSARSGVSGQKSAQKPTASPAAGATAADTEDGTASRTGDGQEEVTPGSPKEAESIAKKVFTEEGSADRPPNAFVSDVNEAMQNAAREATVAAAAFADDGLDRRMIDQESQPRTENDPSDMRDAHDTEGSSGREVSVQEPDHAVGGTKQSGEGESHERDIDGWEEPEEERKGKLRRVGSQQFARGDAQPTMPSNMSIPAAEVERGADILAASDVTNGAENVSALLQTSATTLKEVQETPRTIDVDGTGQISVRRPRGRPRRDGSVSVGRKGIKRPGADAEVIGASAIAVQIGDMKRPES